MKLRSKACLAAIVVAVAGSAGEGCDIGGGTCQTNREYFQREVWGKFMASNCAKCHTPGGLAVDKGAKLVLQNSSYPGFIDYNLAALEDVSKITYEEKSELLLKPLGRMNHGGGQALEEGSDDYSRLKELVSRFKSGDKSCPVTRGPFDDVEDLPPLETFRKAAIDLGGRLPNEDEVAALKAGGESALDATLDGLMKEEMFLERVREMYNDFFLTDSALRYVGASLNFLSADLWPYAGYYQDQKSYADPRRTLANKAIAREPLDLIAYVVKNDRPFTEILTANYALVNPYSAQVYGVTPGFADNNDYDEFKEVQVSFQGTKPGNVVHAGVLSTPSFLNRWQTTPTNRNRARSRRVYQFFLATDILKTADRPVDASQLTAIQNPTVNSEYCNVCHRSLDPVAGAFRGYNDYDYERFDPDDKWHSDMDAPGFGSDKMDPAFYSKALQWLAPKMADDPRFALGAVYVAYQGLTGRKPMSFPIQITGGDKDIYSAQIDAWGAQDAFFRATAEKFKESKFNFKTLIKMIVKSQYYRGVSATSDGSPTGDAKLADVGIGQLLSPEQLNRKIVAVMGAHWRKDYDYVNQHDFLVEDYTILYGGMDSSAVTERSRDPNGIMAAVVVRMANEMSCRVAAWDFLQTQAERRFFKMVTVDQVPMSAGAEVPQTIISIKDNIRYLHQLILGEDLAPDDPEIDRTYQIFLGAWKELAAATPPKTQLEYYCWGRSDPMTGAPITDVVNTDKNFTIRAWTAVLTYLLSDWKFTTH